MAEQLIGAFLEDRFVCRITWTVKTNGRKTSTLHLRGVFVQSLDQSALFYRKVAVVFSFWATGVEQSRGLAVLAGLAALACSL